MSFFCLWIPQFAAWAHAQNEPDLGDRAFAVCNEGIIAAVSPLAQEAGIQTGMPTKKARSVLSSLTVIQRDAALETRVWNEVKGGLYELTPNVESVRPGLLFAAIQAKSTLSLLQNWQVHAGQGNDRATAELAALTGEIGEVRCVRHKREAPFADRVPLETLAFAGISMSALEHLQSMGWKSVGALRVLTLSQLKDQVGCEAERVFRLAQGPKEQENLRPIAPLAPARQVSASHTFAFPVREAAEWEGELSSILDRLHADLAGCDASTLELRIETPIVALTARRILKSGITGPEFLLAPAHEALKETLRSLAPLPTVLLSLEVSLGVAAESGSADTLFGCEEAAPEPRPSRWHTVFKGIETRIGNKARPAKAVPYVEGTLSLFPALEAVNVLDAGDCKMRVVR